MIAAVVLALLGLVLGPSLGVIVDRAVERERLKPLHRCTSCRSDLGPASLLPLVSWFRRCAGCGRHPGWRYPGTDLGAAAALALVGAALGLRGATIGYAAFALVLVVLSVIDLETHLLPNVITYPAFLGGLVLVVVGAVCYGSPERIVSALVGGVSAFVLLFLLHVIRPAGMGMGDVKLAPTLGLALGWLYGNSWLAVSLVLYALLVASLGGGLIGLAVNVVRRRREEIPFGPALAAGTLAILALSPVFVVTR